MLSSASITESPCGPQRRGRTVGEQRQARGWGRPGIVGLVLTAAVAVAAWLVLVALVEPGRWRALLAACVAYLVVVNLAAWSYWSARPSEESPEAQVESYLERHYGEQVTYGEWHIWELLERVGS